MEGQVKVVFDMLNVNDDANWVKQIYDNDDQWELVRKNTQGRCDFDSVKMDMNSFCLFQDDAKNDKKYFRLLPI